MKGKIYLNDDFSIDLTRLIESRLLVQANSGGGKSWLLRRILEQSHGKVQQIVIDLEGEFSTLREKHDYVLVGKDGDTPALVRSAALLARKLLELKASAIIDLSELLHHERKQYVRLFLDSMIDAPKELYTPCLVVIDEAHQFAPEKGESEAASAVIDLCTRGRKRGYCAVLATQRISKLAKDAAAECNNKLIGRSSQDIDMKRASDELGFNSKEQMLSLRSLGAGEFYAFGTAICNAPTRIQVGKVETTHPKVGSRAMPERALAPTEKIKKVIGQLADLPQEAAKEAKTVSELKAEIRSLKAHRCPKVADPKAIERAVLEAKVQTKRESDAVIKALNAQVLKYEKTLGSIARLAGSERTNAQSGVLLAKTTFPKPIVVKSDQVIEANINVDFETEKSEVNVDRPVHGGAFRMLKVLVSRYPMKLTRAQLGTFSLMKPTGGSFGTYLSTLRSKGLIRNEGDLFFATQEGIDYLGDEAPMPPTTSEEMISMWHNNLTGGARKIFDFVVGSYPQDLSKEEIGAAVGMEPRGGSFGTYLSILRSNNLIEVRNGRIKASESLYI